MNKISLFLLSCLLLSVSICYASFSGNFSKLEQWGDIKQKKSQLIKDTLFSESFMEKRPLTIYLPKGFEKKKTYPVIYMADGQLLIKSYAKSIDSLIDKKLIPEIVIIGVNSNETFIPSMALEYRNFEYLKNLNGGMDTLNLRFNKHFKFFTTEVIKYAERKYSASNKKEDRTFYGISNGADFGVTVAQDQPDLIGHYILCSIVQGSKEPFTWTKTNCPRFYLATGNKEDEMVQEEARRLGSYLTTISMPYELFFYDGGHERKMWEIQFINTLPKLYKN
jgi:enterochelin esterase-like enzyme